MLYNVEISKKDVYNRNVRSKFKELNTEELNADSFQK